MPFDHGPDDERGEGVGLAPTRDEEPGAERTILCALCGEPITAARHRLEVAGRHGHTFMNPAATVFHVLCFGRAPGCVERGAPTEEYSWFPSYAWRYAHCRGCGAHLGWAFRRADEPGDDAFFGLIEERLDQG